MQFILFIFYKPACLHSHYTRNCNLFYIPVELIFETSQFGFNSLSPELQNSESIRLLGKRLKNFFCLNQTYSLLIYIVLLSVSFVFFFLIIHFIFHAVPMIRIMYPILSGSLYFTGILHKPSASIQASFTLPPLTFVVYRL